MCWQRYIILRSIHDISVTNFSKSQLIFVRVPVLSEAIHSIVPKSSRTFEQLTIVSKASVAIFLSHDIILPSNSFTDSKVTIKLIGTRFVKFKIQLKILTIKLAGFSTYLINMFLFTVFNFRTDIMIANTRIVQKIRMISRMSLH